MHRHISSLPFRCTIGACTHSAAGVLQSYGMIINSTNGMHSADAQKRQRSMIKQWKRLLPIKKHTSHVHWSFFQQWTKYTWPKCIAFTALSNRASRPYWDKKPAWQMTVLIWRSYHRPPCTPTHQSKWSSYVALFLRIMVKAALFSLRAPIVTETLLLVLDHCTLFVPTSKRTRNKWMHS